jgi:hypothetical protein
MKLLKRLSELVKTINYSWCKLCSLWNNRSRGRFGPKKTTYQFRKRYDLASVFLFSNMLLFSTFISYVGSGLIAGGLTTSPLLISNLEPCQGHCIITEGKTQRSHITGNHGFRKFFETNVFKAGMDPNYLRKLNLVYSTREILSF